MKRKIICIVGTRPEAIKMACLINRLKSESEFDVRVLVTAQHRHLLDQVMKVFDIQADIDLNIMLSNQSLTTLTARLLLKLEDVFSAEKPDIVLAQGDTSTVMAVALACFYHKIAFGHVEAGLRTWDMQNPFPEEMNRVIATRLAKWHFAPTESSRQNLIREGVLDADIFVTGNTVIDTLFNVKDKELELPFEIDITKRLIILTAHRRENFGKPFEQICLAVLALIKKNLDLQFLFPVHPNPCIYEVAHRLLGGHPRITLCQPMEYMPFVSLMKHAYLILSDSGGVQEEAPALRVPVLVLRDETERPEAVQAGVVKLIGTDYLNIITEVQHLLDDEKAYRSMATGALPYGDGNAAERIVNAIKSSFNDGPKGCSDDYANNTLNKNKLHEISKS